MSNPNNRPFSSEQDDDDNDKVKDSSTSFLSERPAAKPLSVNKGIINLSLNRSKYSKKPKEAESPQLAQERPSRQALAIQAVERLRAEQAAALEADSDDDDEETDTTTTKPRRKSIGKKIRAALQRRRLRNNTAPAAVAKSPESADKAHAAPENTASSATVESIQPDPQQEATPVQSSLPQQKETIPSITELAPPPEAPPIILPPLPPAAVQAHAARSARTNVEPEPSSKLHAADLMPLTTSALGYNQSPSTVIAQGGVTGPVSAFLAANFLSKRRDNKIIRDANKTKRALQETQDTVRKEKAHTSRLEDTVYIRPQTPTANRQTRPETAPVAATATLQESVPNQQQQRPVKLAEVLATATIIREQPSEQASVRPLTERQNIKETTTNPAHAEANQAANNEHRHAEQTKTAEDTQQQTERPAQPDRVSPPELFNLYPQTKPEERRQLVKESVFERRHEVKDDPLAREIPQSRAAPASRSSTHSSQPAASSQQSISSPATANQLSFSPNVSTAPSGTDLYHQSMRAGFIVGIVMAVVGFITYVFI